MDTRRGLSDIHALEMLGGYKKVKQLTEYNFFT